MKYRQDIDGLRAVAVVPVILFHAGLPLFSGGFIGVDIFFVISGYLITSILITELERGDFSIVRFYERRARRILPALFLVMLCCIPFAWMWMLPLQLKDLSQTTIAVTLFSSNILFWWKQGYFAPLADLKPLLHTWSLAVEEQYYLFFPISLMLLWRFGRNRVFWLVIAGALLSFGLSEWAWRNAPEANFYLAPTRAWELLAGSICAFMAYGKPQRSNNPLSALGLGLILFSIFYFDSKTPFPSVYALAPIIGTVLIILFGGSDSWTAKLLSASGFVGIGLISYSAYLWHQPLFAFARIRSVTPPSQWLMIGLAALSFALAYLSWRFVEKPFRQRSGGLLPNRRAVFVASAAGAAILAGMGLLGQLQKGFPDRPNPNVDIAELDNREMENEGLHDDCVGRFTLSSHCRTSDAPEILLWGDSYAMHLVQGLVSSDKQIKLQQHTNSSCSPILGLAKINEEHGVNWARSCIEFNDQVIAWLKNNKSVKYVVISSKFDMLTDSILLRDGTLTPGDITGRRNIPLIASELIETAERIRAIGRRVIIVSPTPSNGADTGGCLKRALLFGAADGICDFSLRRDLVNRPAFDLMGKVAPRVPIMWLDHMICPNDICDTLRDRTIIYRDMGHLSKEGSAYLGQKYRWADLVRSKAQ
ncbi:MAG: acyltransferase family protein [Sphingomonas bacterium]